jgi:hypothetical protein
VAIFGAPPDVEGVPVAGLVARVEAPPDVEGVPVAGLVVTVGVTFEAIPGVTPGVTPGIGLLVTAEGVAAPEGDPAFWGALVAVGEEDAFLGGAGLKNLFAKPHTAGTTAAPIIPNLTRVPILGSLRGLFIGC